jgi:hypothetical protein
MDTDLDAVLRRVAAGELTPEQALPLIDAAQRASAPSGAPEWGTPGTGAGSTGGPETEHTAAGREGPVSGVRVSASYRSVDVVADPTVDNISVSGVHAIRREGDVLVVEINSFHGFTEFDEGPVEMRGAWSFMPRSAAWARSMKGEHLTVRINPRLPITIDSVGAAVRVSGCEGGARIRVVAASLKLDRLRGPLEIDALTSSVKGTAAVTGSSRISAESASVKLSLLEGTDVRVSASSNRMGKIVLPGRPESGGSGTTSVLGAGAGRLVVDGVMSSVVLTADGATRRASA